MAAVADPIDDNDTNVRPDWTAGEPAKGDIFSKIIISAGRDAALVPECQIPDFCHDAEDIAFQEIPGGKPSYVNFGAAVSIAMRTKDKKGVERNYPTAENIVTKTRALLTSNGAARGDTILETMLPQASLDSYKIGTYSLDNFDILTEAGGPMHSAVAIIQDSCPFNAFVSKKTSQPLIGAGRGGSRLKFIDNIITKLDGATKLSSTSIGAHMEYIEDKTSKMIHMFLPGYRHQYSQSDDGKVLTITIYKLSAANAWENICTVSCAAGISVNAVCQSVGIPAPRGTGGVGKKLKIQWNIPEPAREPALILYIKTLTDWAQFYYSSMMWHDCGILVPVITLDTFAARAAEWLKCPMVLLVSPKGYADMIVYEPSALNITDDQKRIIRGKFETFDGEKDRNLVILADMNRVALEELASIPYLQTRSNMYCYLMASEIGQISANMTRKYDELVSDINNWRASAEADNFYRKYFALFTKSIIEYMVDLIRPITELTTKYSSTHYKIVSAFSRWRKNEETPEKIIGLMQSLMPADLPTPADFMGAWLSYMPLVGNNDGIPRDARIMTMYRYLQAKNFGDIATAFLKYCAVHYKLDTSGKPKIHFARIIGTPPTRIEDNEKSYTVFTPKENAVTKEAAASAIAQGLLGQANIFAVADRTILSDKWLPNDDLSTEQYMTVLDARLETILQIVQNIPTMPVDGGAGGDEPAVPIKVKIINASKADIAGKEPLYNINDISPSFFGRIIAVARNIRTGVANISDKLLGSIYKIERKAMGGAGGADPGFAPLQVGDAIIQVGGNREVNDGDYCIMHDINTPVSGDYTVNNIIHDKITKILDKPGGREVSSLADISTIIRTGRFDLADDDERFIDVMFTLLEALQEDADESGWGDEYYMALKNLKILRNVLEQEVFIRQLSYYIFYSDAIGQIIDRALGDTTILGAICFQFTVWFRGRRVAGSSAVQQGTPPQVGNNKEQIVGYKRGRYIPRDEIDEDEGENEDNRIVPDEDEYGGMVPYRVVPGGEPELTPKPKPKRPAIGGARRTRRRKAPNLLRRLRGTRRHSTREEFRSDR